MFISWFIPGAFKFSCKLSLDNAVRIEAGMSASLHNVQMYTNFACHVNFGVGVGSPLKYQTLLMGGKFEVGLVLCDGSGCLLPYSRRRRREGG